jgi:hypothetical protein
MKVSPTGSIVTGEIAAEKKKKAESLGEGNFETLLKKAVDGAGAPQGDIPPAFLKATAYPGASGILHSGSVTRMETLDRADKLLAILDDYTAKLADPRYTLKEIQELVVGMETEKNLLLPLMESLPEGDGARDLLNRILVTASVESIKFNRGDYLP